MNNDVYQNHTSSRKRFWTSLVAVTAAAAIALSTVTALPAAADADSGISVDAVQTNGRTNPLGLPGEAPTFSWVSSATGRDVQQSAYEVRVATSIDSLGSGNLWSTGKMMSANQLDVTYAGPALTSKTRYFWQVKVWDGQGQESAWSEPGWFETGLVSTSDWTADWIGKSAGGEIDKWTNYTADVNFSIENLAMGFFFRAKDVANAYMWQITVADGTPRLKLHKRVGGGYSVIENKNISSTITKAELLAGRHTLSTVVDGNTVTTKLDGSVIDTRSDSTFAKGYIGFRSDSANEGLEKFTIYSAKVTAKTGEVLLDTDLSTSNPFTGGGTYTTGKLSFSGVADSLWKSPDSNRPLLRKEFATASGKTVAQARVYASAHGIYELNLNGQKVGDQELAPGYTDYRKRIQYQSYDVTDQIANGNNAIGAALADGWWAGKVGMWGPGVYGSELSLIAELHITYTDGTTEVVKTDSSWKSHFGPFAFTDNIDGETYDARAEQTGWDKTGYSDASWSPVSVKPATDTPKLVAQPDEPIRVTQEMPTKVVTEPTPGAHIYDLAQNMVGVARMRLQGAAGQTITIRYGEELNPDGTLYTANLRGAKVTDRYTFATTGSVEYIPTFTQHGFRYIEITGALTQVPTAEEVTGLVWESDLADTGTLETSNGMLNQLTSNISWGQRGNFLSIPTDTPARDERLGWTGDINVFSPTASYLKDTRAFLGKWMDDLRDSQRPDGSFPGISPETMRIDAGVGWQDAGITVPYAVWKAYGDNSIVRENYASMKTFLTYVRAGAGADLIDADRNVHGDWLNLDDDTPGAVMATAYFAEDARMMAEMARSIGEEDDADEFLALSDQIRVAFAANLVSEDGTVSGNSQTGYAMALGMNMLPEDMREAVGEKFVAKLALSDNHLTTGFLGTPWLLPALTSIGRTDLAYTMILKEDYPSWGYEIANGATTMWERWNSIMPDGSFGDVTMNSFNHYAYGAVGDWMYQNIGGIAPTSAGYKTFSIAPQVGGGLTSGRGSFESAYGSIVSDWASTDSGFNLAVEVPVNTTATVTIPAANLFAITEGETFLSDTAGISDVTLTGDKATFTAGSGSYAFVVNNDHAYLGEILDQIQGVDDRAAAIADAGDLTSGDRGTIGTALTDALSKVQAGLLADVAGNTEQVPVELNSALSLITDLESWLVGSSIDSPVRADLTARLQRLETLLGKAIASSSGVTVKLSSLADAVLGGTEISGTIGVANAGAGGITDVTASVSVAGWSGDAATATLDSVSAGENVSLPFTLPVPKHQKTGEYDATVTLTFRAASGSYTVEVSKSSWVTVTSGISITDVVSTFPTGGSEERATVDVTVKNDTSTAIAGQVTATVPSNWKTPVPSTRTVVAAGDSATITLPLFVGLNEASGNKDITVFFVDGVNALAQKKSSVAVELVSPPTQTVLDHVDFGDGPSESAHAVQASPSSGTNSEAGLTRRYANASTPGSWYSAEYQVTAGEPFILRNRETFDGARTKRYLISIDGTLFTNYTLVRTEGGAGSKTYQILVDDPALLANDGTVRIKYEYPGGVPNFFDPSLADSWILPVSEDTLAPDVSAAVSSSAQAGDNGWFRGDSAVTVTAVDNVDNAPAISVGANGGWQPYLAPLPVSGDGKHTVYYRAKDAAGNSSGEKSVAVWIDGTAPRTQLSIGRKSGIQNADRATLTFSAEDSLSGVAHTRYRIDGGSWTTLSEESPLVEGFGQHQIEYYSIDAAGNPEVRGSTTVALEDVDKITALVAPKVSGSSIYGTTMKATTGTWDTKDLVFGYQWLRDGKPVNGKTATSYVISKADVGHRLSVKVTASKPGKEAFSSTSAVTAKVAKARSSAKVKFSATKIKRGKGLGITTVVTSPTTRPSGSVRITVDGKTVRTVTLKNGKAIAKIAISKAGTHTVIVSYRGNSVVAPSKAVTKKIRVY